MRRIAFFILAFLPFLTNAQFANETEPYIIKVQGEFIAKQKPENIIVSLSITETDKEYQTCFDNAFKTLNTLKKAFTKNGILEESIKTKDLSVQEDFAWDNSKRIKKGYKAFINMEIENAYNEKFTNNLLKSLSEYTFEVNYNISFCLSDKQKEELRERAIKESVNDALKKAKIIAEASKVELGEIYRINYGNSLDFGYGGIDNDIVNDELLMPMTQQINDKEIDFNPKEISIKKTILVEWKIKK